MRTEFVAHVFAVMATAERHTFQVLTKRPRRMHAMPGDTGFWDRVTPAAVELGAPPAAIGFARWPGAGETPPGSLGRQALVAADTARRESALSAGAIVAVAQLTGIHRGDRCSIWPEPGAWHWQLIRVVPIDPAPAAGTAAYASRRRTCSPRCTRAWQIS